MMMATFDAEGNVNHVYNYDSPKSDAYPIVQLPAAEHRLRGFNWQPDLRPKDKFDVTSMVVRDSEREAYEARPHADFPQTNIYFPGHMKEVYQALEDAKTKRNARQVDTTSPSGLDPESPSTLDSLQIHSDSLSSHPRPDLGSLNTLDSLAVSERSDAGGLGGTPPDESGAEASEAASGSQPGMTIGEPGESPADTTYMSDRELKKAMRVARRDARWAELDQRDLDKAARKEARKAARKARREAREAAHQARQAAIDEAKLKKYIERYQKLKERHEGRKQKPEPAGERPPGIEAGGELPATIELE